MKVNVFEETLDLQKEVLYERVTAEEIAQLQQAGIVLILPLHSDRYRFVPAVALHPHSRN